MPEPSAIGRQLRKLREERFLSQAELAERAEVSQDLVAKLEQGSRQSARLTSLAKLARALDADLSELLDRRPRIELGGDTGDLLAVRDVLLSPSSLPGIDSQDDGGEVTAVADVRAAVEAGWHHYWSGEFGRVAGILPGLIGEARLTQSAHGSAGVGPLAQSYQLAAYLMVHMGKGDLAAIAAERALRAAARADDELQWATLHGSYSWVLLNQGRFAESESHASRIAEQVEPRLTKAPAEQVTVWGGLALTALAAAAAAGRSSDAGEYISLSRAAAARVGADRRDYWVSFGPTQVAVQTAHAYVILGSPSRALKAADGVHKDDLFRVAYARHLLDVGQAQLEVNLPQAAITTLQEARALSPEWFRHQGPARSIVADLFDHQRRITPALRQLAAGLGVN